MIRWIKLGWHGILYNKIAPIFGYFSQKPKISIFSNFCGSWSSASSEFLELLEEDEEKGGGNRLVHELLSCSAVVLCGREGIGEGDGSAWSGAGVRRAGDGRSGGSGEGGSSGRGGDAVGWSGQGAALEHAE